MCHMSNKYRICIKCLGYTNYIQEESEDTKGAIIIRIWKKNRQNNGKKKKDKMTNNDLQNTTQKTKDRPTRTQPKSGGES